MNDKQIGIILGAAVATIVMIPTMYITGRKSYKAGIRDGAYINQEFNVLGNKAKDMINKKDRA